MKVRVALRTHTAEAEREEVIERGIADSQARAQGAERSPSFMAFCDCRCKFKSAWIAHLRMQRARGRAATNMKPHEQRADIESVGRVARRKRPLIVSQASSV